MPCVFVVVGSTLAVGIGIIFNGYILFVLLWQRGVRTANNILLLHLAFVDIVYCLVVIISNTAISALESTFSSTPCEIIGFMWTLLPTVVVWTVCGLSCDRYAAISTPLHYSRLVNARRAVYFAVMSWLLGAILASPPLLGVCPYCNMDFRLSCVAYCRPENVSETCYVIFYAVLSVLLPVVVILISNLHIFMIARYHRHRIVAAIYEVTLRAQATVTHQRNPCYLSKFKGRSAFLTISQLVGSLAVFTLPYFVVMVWESLTGRTAHPVLVQVVIVLLTCTPPVNAYVYGVKSRVLRQTLKRLLQRHLFKQEATREVRKRLIVTTRPNLCRRYSAPANTELEVRAVPVNSTPSCETKHLPKVRRMSLPGSTITVLTANALHLPPCPEEE